MNKLTSILFFAFMTLFLLSCGENSETKNGIVSYLNSKTMGVKIEYNFEEIKPIEKFTVNEVIDDYYKNLEFTKDKTLADVLKDVEKLSKELIEFGPNDPSTIAWKFKSDRINELSKKNKSDIEYYIVKAKYNFKNPMLNNAEVELSKYFILNSENKVIASKSEEDFINIEKEHNKTPLTKYELIILSETYNVEL